MQLTGNTIFITGGTSGIGRGLAETLHRRGNQVIIAGRRQNLLDEITAANPGMKGFVLDVQDSESIDSVTAQIAQEYPQLNVLFNNAGISRNEDLATGSTDISTAREMIETNILSVMHLTAGLLPTLKAQPSSTIVTTTSGLAFLPRADFPTYCASKAFLHSWLQSLRFQLKTSSVEVLELIPPYVQTELTGPDQVSDPRAMPLDEYVGEVISIIEKNDFPLGEIIVERAKKQRFAERNGEYEEFYAAYHQLVA